LEFIGHKITEHDYRFRAELLDALAEGEKIDGR
jgi:hypothetical protein